MKFLIVASFSPKNPAAALYANTAAEAEAIKAGFEKQYPTVTVTQL